MMVYNPVEQLVVETDEVKRRSGQCSTRSASWFRAELVVRFSEDEGESWSKPVVVAKMDRSWLSYPTVLELSPGKVWLTTIQTGLKLAFSETDLL